MREQYNTYLTPEEEARFRVWAESQGRSNDVNDYDLRGYYASVKGRAEDGHLPDTFKKPNHPTFSEESQYSGVPSGTFGGNWVPTPVDDVSVYEAQPTNSTPRLEQYFEQVEPQNYLVRKKTK